MARRVDDQHNVDTLGATTHRTLQARDWKVGVNNQDINALANGEGFLVGYQTRVDEKNGSFTLNEAEVANSLSALWPNDTSHRSMTLVHAEGESILRFPSRFGSNANVTEGQAQSIAHSAGAPAVYRKSARAQTNEDSETWVEGDYANTLNSFDVGDTRTTHAIVGGTAEDDPLLPVGLDSHRYRCCGNGVVASVAEWIGHRIVEVDRRWREEGE
jgi:site-specific DNA-cytosine methylase